MAIDRRQKLQERALFFADDFKPEVHLFLCKACDFLHLDFQFLIDLLNILVEFLVGLNLFILVVNCLQFHFEGPPLVADHCDVAFDLGGRDFFAIVSLHADDGEIFEVVAAFDEDSVVDHFVDDVVVVAAEDEVDALDFVGELDVVVLHHVGQGDDQVALLLFSQFDHHGLREVDEGDVGTDFFVDGVKGVDPLFLGQTEDSDLDPVDVEDVRLQSFRQSALCALVVDVA
jgi:hypothetical protein